MSFHVPWREAQCVCIFLVIYIHHRCRACVVNENTSAEHTYTCVQGRTIHSQGVRSTHPGRRSDNRAV